MSLAPTLQDLVVEPCSAREAADFVIAHHYTHAAKGTTATHTYRIIHKQTNQILGAAIFGPPGQLQTLKKYNGNGAFRLVELRRLVLLDEAPKNSESRVLSDMFRLLRKTGIQRVLSYSDPNEVRTDHPDGRHTGLIYRATGFHKVKEVTKTKAIWWNGRRYPIRNLDQYVNHHEEPPNFMQCPEEKRLIREEKCPITKSSPSGRRKVWIMKQPEERIGIAQKLRTALADGSAVWKSEIGKIAYVKDLVKGLPYFDPPRRSVTDVQEIDRAKAEQQIQAAWRAYQATAKPGLDFGRVNLDWQQKLGNQRESELLTLWQKAGIPPETAGYWIEKYKEFKGFIETDDSTPSSAKPPAGSDISKPTHVDITLTPENISDTRCLSMAKERLKFVWGKIELLRAAKGDPGWSQPEIEKTLEVYRRALRGFSRFIEQMGEMIS